MGLFSSPTLISDASVYATAANLAPHTVEEAQKAKSYDFIVCGGGTAGCVIASRLSEDPNTSVLVLEAGGNNDALEVKAPLVFTKNFKTERDWDYTTTPQASVLNKEMQWPRGKLIGGSSSITGPFLASLLLGIGDVAGKYYVPKLGPFIIYAIMIVILIWRPNGLFGRTAAR